MAQVADLGKLIQPQWGDSARQEVVSVLERQVTFGQQTLTGEKEPERKSTVGSHNISQIFSDHRFPPGPADTLLKVL